MCWLISGPVGVDLAVRRILMWLIISQNSNSAILQYLAFHLTGREEKIIGWQQFIKIISPGRTSVIFSFGTIRPRNYIVSAAFHSICLLIQPARSLPGIFVATLSAVSFAKSWEVAINGFETRRNFFVLGQHI